MEESACYQQAKAPLSICCVVLLGGEGHPTSSKSPGQCRMCSTHGPAATCATSRQQRRLFALGGWNPLGKVLKHAETLLQLQNHTNTGKNARVSPTCLALQGDQQVVWSSKVSPCWENWFYVAKMISKSWFGRWMGWWFATVATIPTGRCGCLHGIWLGFPIAIRHRKRRVKVERGQLLKIWCLWLAWWVL